ncbi:GHKL domain-containing protein [Paucihalobacter ruber]|uniref:histidine kinase n=1 Tax=Paucihalobacter ruber TaxID=2567861 RepID=A0A506PGQ6_9FLAO|nr:ATP-binding protein [Paucihalobacter ruber]TPV32764.1 GHKL domain-containing protein [Paucihalobacter ruber]
MNQNLKHILDFIESSNQISDDDKATLIKSLKNADKDLTISEFKLERTEKVKRTTAILLEETIEELEQKRKAIEDSNQALQKSLQDLKATQSQLIQSEKMASLGELTAGIAHEIQNPLNFVNNFSEVSVELMQEVREVLDTVRAYRDRPIPEDALDDISTILDDIESNLEKINHHGKRADGIVKGMLQHSRSSSGTKEDTNINVLVDEYLRLAYHGLRAKDKSFNAALETHLDDSIENINIVPQDIGRVVLNLITNAFYAVTEKKKQQPENYEPTVTVSTKKSNNNVLISVEDNGNGIPQAIVDKIFQPFFTTKPTGQGTGLGLSLSYDIVKAHGGALKVETKSIENLQEQTEVTTGTKFIIQLPLK